MSKIPHVSSDANILGGQPCFAGTRVPVDALFVNLAAGERLDVLLYSYPEITREGAVAVLREACRLIRERALDEANLPPDARAAIGPLMFEEDWEGLSKTDSERHYGRP
jgi:uncharacterized protein (DUF433 family)